MRMKGKYRLVADFDSLPHDIKAKLKKGIYKIPKSKQVEGKMRFVINDDNNIKAKEITGNWEKINPNTLETFRSLAIQAQMRLILEKLDAIQELQSYQIDIDRNRDIYVPFLNARDYIVRAQNGGSLEYKRENLKKATEELTKAINAIYTDFKTTSEHFAKLTKRIVFQNTELIRTFIGYLTLDLQLVTMYIGVQMHVFDYLGESANSNQVLERYQYNMKDFFTKSINKQNKSAVMLIHEYYPYNKNNLNYWYKLAMDMKSALQADLESIEGKEIYLISVKDERDEDEL